MRARRKDASSRVRLTVRPAAAIRNEAEAISLEARRAALAGKPGGGEETPSAARWASWASSASRRMTTSKETREIVNGLRKQ